MLGRGEHLLHRPVLDDLSAIHHADGIRDTPHDTEIVSDEQHAHAEPGPDVCQQFQNLCLHRDIECRSRLIRNQKIRFVRQRHGNHHPLALATGQLMRIAGKTGFRFGNADLRQQLQGALTCLRAAHAAVQIDHLADLRLDGVKRIKRSHRLLKDDRDIVAADAANLVLAHAEQILPLEANASSRVMRGRIRQKLQNR